MAPSRELVKHEAGPGSGTNFDTNMSYTMTAHGVYLHFADLLVALHVRHPFHDARVHLGQVLGRIGTSMPKEFAERM